MVNVNMGISSRKLKFTILECLASARREHKINLLGRSHSRGEGSMEHHLGVTFDNDTRFLADRAFEDLKADGLIRPTYGDIAEPEKWVEITDSGRRALERRTLDPLDEALCEVDSHLLEMRDGAWSMVASSSADALRQAAHSARELIDQTLRKVGHDEIVRSMPDFKPDATSRSGITRRHRVKAIMYARRGAISDGDIRIVEAACDLVVAVSSKLTAAAHSDEAPDRQDVIDALHMAEVALRKMLIGPQ